MSSEGANQSCWRVVGRSVLGASHRRRKLPNQDAWACWPERGGTAIVLAVADGHGSSRTPRSGDGARLAVRTAVAVLRELLDGEGPLELEALRARAATALPRILVERWREAVQADVQLHPLPGSGAAGPFGAYGTTLLAAAATSEALVLLQLGDGDILTVTDGGLVTRPVPGDARLIANETTSLSAAGAALDFRSAVISLSQTTPALILVSTDGYANSFRDDAGFRQVGSDLLTLIRTEGLEAVEANLEGWLREASEQGSGDDVTLGLLYRGASQGEGR